MGDGHTHYELHVHEHTNDPAIYSETHSYDFSEKVSASEIQQILSLWIEDIKAWVKNNGGFTGHIKIFAESRENLWLSSTGRSINVNESSGWNQLFMANITVNVTAIIFGVSPDTLKEVCRRRLETCIESLKI